MMKTQAVWSVALVLASLQGLACGDDDDLDPAAGTGGRAGAAGKGTSGGGAGRAGTGGGGGSGGAGASGSGSGGGGSGGGGSSGAGASGGGSGGAAGQSSAAGQAGAAGEGGSNGGAVGQAGSSGQGGEAGQGGSSGQAGEAGQGGSAGGSAAPAPFAAYAAFGELIGEGGIATAHVNGRTELYMAATNDYFVPQAYWYALARNAATSTYEMVYVSPYYIPSVTRLGVGDVHPKPGPEIVLLVGFETIEVRSAATKELLASFPLDLTVGGAVNLRFFDSNGDGLDEIWASSWFGVRAYESNGDVVFGYDDDGGDFVVGEFDGQPGLELATSGIDIVDINTGEKRCVGLGVRGRWLGASDVDDDGRQELIAVESPDYYEGVVRVIDVDTCQVKWSRPTFEPRAMLVADADADGRDEVIVGDRNFDGLVAYSLETQQELWSFGFQYGDGSSELAVDDVDGDGRREVVWASGLTSTKPDRLHVGDAVTEKVEFTSSTLEGPFAGPRAGDVDGDGVPEIVAAWNDAEGGVEPGRVVVFDGQTLRLKAMSPPLGHGLAREGTHDVQLVNVDDDPELEVVVSSDAFASGLIEIFDVPPGGPFVLKWQNNTLPEGVTFRSFGIADIDGDGDLDVVAGGGIEHTGADGLFVYIYDYTTGNQIWRSPALTTAEFGAIEGLALADSDGDGKLEIHAMVDDGQVYVFDGVTKELQATVPGAFRAIDVRPPPGGGALSLWAAGVDGSLRAYGWDGTGFAPQESFQLVDDAPLEAFTFDASGGVYAAHGRVLSYHPAPAAAPAWAIDDWGPGIGHNVVLLDSGQTLFTTTDHAVVAFRFQ